MELGTANMAFPILEFASKVYHFTPRKPTVFERVLLKMHDRLSDNETYNNISLRHIFEQILCVPDADILVKPALDNLVDLDVFKCPKHYYGLEQICLRDLQRTIKGDQMLENDMLPAVATDHTVQHTYDPIRDCFLNDNQKRLLGNNPMSFSVSADPFLQVYPSQKIAESVAEQKPAWWTPETQIDRVKRIKRPRIRWRQQRGRFCLAGGSSTLTIEFKDKCYSEYLSGLSADEVHRKYIRPFLLDGNESTQWFDILKKVDFNVADSAIADCFIVSQLPSRIRWQSGIHIIQELPGVCSVPDKIPSGTVVISFTDQDIVSDYTVSWNNSHDGVCIRLAGNCPVSEVLFYSHTQKICLAAGILDLRFKGTAWNLPLGFEYDREHIPQETSQVLTEIGEKLAESSQPEDILALVFWQPASKVWNRVFELVKNHGQDFPEICGQLLDYKNQLQMFSGNQDISTWDKDICSLFTLDLDRFDSPVGTKRLEPAIQALAQCNIEDTEELAKAIEKTCSKLEPPDSIESLESILGLFKCLGPAVPFLSKLHTPEVISDCLNRFCEDSFQSQLKDRNSFEKNLRALKNIEGRLKQMISCKDLLTFNKQTQYRSTLRLVDLEDAKDCCKGWLAAWKSLLDSSPELIELLPNTNIEKIHANISDYNEFLGKFVTDIPQNIRAVYIVDTNIFIDQPGILARFKPHELVVVSKKVVDELDDKKTDENLRQRVAQTTRALQNYAGNNLRYEEADTSLLPQGFKPKADNLILSVALKYKPCGPILLTSDRNLSVKAKMEGLRTQTLPDFNKRQLRSPSIPIKEIKKQNSRKKRKNKAKKRKRR